MEDIGKEPIKIGFYTCSPSKNKGFETEFYILQLKIDEKPYSFH